MTPAPKDLECACAAVRHASRLITQIYEDELREHLAVPQFALLSVLDSRPGCSQAVLAKALDFDKTTLSRNLKLMESKGWIAHSASADQRERGYRLTPAGLKLLKAAKPGWKRAQHRLRTAMTSDRWNAMWRTFDDIRAAVHQVRKP
jgi:DNA-binding MarR family transcriptional regulator